MTLAALRDDALSTTPGGFALRLGLPWIRSLPLNCLGAIEVVVDGHRVDPLGVALGERIIDHSDLVHERGWWFIQDRVVLQGGRNLQPGTHDVAVSFGLVIPYLQSSPDGPLTLPFRIERQLVLDATATVRSVSRDVA